MECYSGEQEAQRRGAMLDDQSDVEFEREEMLKRGFQWFTVFGYWNEEKCTQDICAMTRDQARRLSDLDNVYDVMTQDEITA